MKKQLTSMVAASLLIAAVLLTGCQKAAETEVKKEEAPAAATSDTTVKDAYAFSYNGTDIFMNAEAKAVLSSLGKEKSYFEAPSCAFEGMDKIYSYNGFDLKTYQLKDVEYVNSVVLLDDTVQTKEGVYIGMGKEEVVSKMGDTFTEGLNKLTYTKGDSTVNFIFESDKLVSVEYIAIVK